MTETTYKAFFKYEGKEPIGLEKMILEDIYVRVYNEWCEMVTYDEWNGEWEKLGGEFDGIDENGTINPDGQYCRYIRGKQQELVDTVLNPMLFENIVKYGGRSRINRFLIGEECDLEMELDDGTVMQMYLKAE